MPRTSPLFVLATAALLTAAAWAQPGAHPGVDVSLGILGPQIGWGGRTGAIGTGITGFVESTTSCNLGSINVPWFPYMDPRHPVIAFLVARERNGRLYQISDRSYAKHGFFAVSDSQCSTCSYPSNGTWLGIGCSDTYATANNGDDLSLAPPDEIDPWTGVWTPNCSLFDRGFPRVPPPQDCDGLESFRVPPAGAGWRVRILDSELVGGGSYWYCGQYVLPAWTQQSVGPTGQPVPQLATAPTGPLCEPEANRANNLASRGMSVVFNNNNGITTFTTVGVQLQGSVLQRWSGATVDSATNGQADGRVLVAVKVTGPSAGLYHYEYAVHNRDNAGGIASFRVPVCSQAQVRNAGFHDIDVPVDPSNDWSFVRQGNELVWNAPVTNALRWNSLYNFWFDSDAAPESAAATLFQANLLRGAAPSFAVASQAPLGLYNVFLGAGCGVPTAPGLIATGAPARATPGNASFALVSGGNLPGAPCALFASLVPGSVAVPPCTLYLGPDLQSLFPLVPGVADSTGVASYPLPIPADPSLQGTAVQFQALQGRVGGQLLGLLDLSDGLQVRIGSSIPSCP